LDKITTIIIDDEQYGRTNFEYLLKTYCPEVEITASATSAQEAKGLILKHNPDTIFLDISMPVVDGFDLLQSIPERNFSVVFVTAHGEYGIKALKAGAIDYLLKPVSISELKGTVIKLIAEKQKKQQIQVSIQSKIALNCFQETSIHDLNDIIRLEADDNYTKVHLKDKKQIVLSKTLKHFDCILEDKDFFRIHKSHIINLHHIKEYSSSDGGYVVMSDSVRLIVSRRRYDSFAKWVKKMTMH
jgi:two-component system LytT family response regulator